MPNCNLPLSSLELFALMSSYKPSMGKETMACMCEVLSNLKGTDLIDTNVARVRRPCSSRSWWVWCWGISGDVFCCFDCLVVPLRGAHVEGDIVQRPLCLRGTLEALLK